MAFADLPALLAALAAPSQQLDFTKAGLVARNATQGVSLTSQWTRTGLPSGAGAAPGTTPVVCTNATAGGFQQQDASAGSLYAAIRRFVAQMTSVQVKGDGISKIIIADRLSHVSGMDGTLTTPQLTGGMGITRSTSGDGVFAALEIYTAVGNVTTATVSYTNQAGTPGQVSQPITFGSTTANNTGRFLPVSLAAGDTGVRDVASVTLAANTATAGDFGVTLYKPLLTIPCLDSLSFPMNGDPLRATGGYLPIIPAGACLWMIITDTQVGNSISTGIVAELALMEA